MRVLWISTLGKRVLALPHYIENPGDEDLVILEMFSASEFLDVSLKYWITHGQVLHNLTDLKLSATRGQDASAHARVDWVKILQRNVSRETQIDSSGKRARLLEACRKLFGRVEISTGASAPFEESDDSSKPMSRGISYFEGCSFEPAMASRMHRRWGGEITQ